MEGLLSTGPTRSILGTMALSGMGLGKGSKKTQQSINFFVDKRGGIRNVPSPQYQPNQLCCTAGEVC